MPASNLQYKNPPVKEAIFGIRFAEALSFNTLSKFSSSSFAKDNFLQAATWKINSRHEGRKGDAEPEVLLSERKEGFIVRSKNPDRLLQFYPDRLTYHNLNRYAGWDVIFSELQEIWEEFIQSVGEITITQLSVRYLNEIAIPLPLEKGFNEYVTLLPSIPAGMTTALNNFFIQVEFPGKTPNIQALITETILGIEEGKKINFLLDLGVAKNERFLSNSLEIWNSLKEIREWKNELFEMSFTDKVKKTFE